MPPWLRKGLRGLAHALAPPETKKSATGALIALANPGAPAWTPRDYASLAREGFTKNPVVYRCVRMVAEAAASVPIVACEGPTRLSEHPCLSLLARPNPVQSGPDLFEAFYGYLLVSGNAYLEAVSLDGTPRELHSLRPDRMRVIPGPDGWPEAYEYTVNGQTVRFAQDRGGVRPILHMALFHPVHDHYGLSPIEAALGAIDTHNAAARWNKALLDNAARPSGALVYANRDQNLSTEQFERLKTELEQSFQGPGNAGRPLVLEGGLDWKSMGFSPKDMDFIEAKYVAAREIALALGVPPMLLAIPGDNTYSNYQEANRSFWRQSVLPLVNRGLQAISGWLAPAYGEALRLEPDLDRIDALAAEREALWERVRAADFLTINEKRAAVGLPPLAGGDGLRAPAEGP